LGAGPAARSLRVDVRGDGSDARHDDPIHERRRLQIIKPLTVLGTGVVLALGASACASTGTEVASNPVA